MTIRHGVGMLIVAATFAVLGGESTAKADDLSAIFRCGGGHSGGRVMVRDQIPYFALYPPVYYSRPVARPYGYSPFAYPGFYKTPEPKIIRPAMIINPYVPRKATSASEGKVTTTRPKVILNPYLVAASTVAERSTPVVYPARSRTDP